MPQVVVSKGVVRIRSPALSGFDGWGVGRGAGRVIAVMVGTGAAGSDVGMVAGRTGFWGTGFWVTGAGVTGAWVVGV